MGPPLSLLLLEVEIEGGEHPPSIFFIFPDRIYTSGPVF